MKNMTKKAKIEYVRNRIARDDEFAVMCLLAVAQADSAMRTGVGFRKCDSRICWSFVRQHQERRSLSEGQMVVVRRVMAHYARQMVERHIPAEWIEAEMAAGAPAETSGEGAAARRVEGDADLGGWASCRGL